MAAPEPEPRSARGAWIVVSLLLMGSVLMGVRAYSAYANSERVVQAAIQDFSTRGATLDIRGCIYGGLDWYGSCADEAMPALCEVGLGMALTHCFSAQERDAACAGPGGEYDPHWTYQECSARELPGRDLNKRCDDSWRTFHSFCANDQEGVRL